jgi:hypothetical protein
MPGFPVLTTLQPIVGVDMHKSIPPPPPVGPLMVPHVVVWGSGLSQKTGFLWATASTSKASSPESNVQKPVLVGAGHACGRGHDAGPHPGHIWPNALLPLILLGSASKSEFGASKVKISVSQVQGGTSDLGVNVAYVMNLNLDCQDMPLPSLPTGFCFAVNYSVYAGFSFKDACHGLTQMVADSALTWLVGVASIAVSGVLKALCSSGIVTSIMGGFAWKSEKGLSSAAGLMADGAGWFASNGRLFVDGWKFMPAALATAWETGRTDLVTGAIGQAFGIGVGTPIGYAPYLAPVGGAAPGTANYGLTSFIDKLFQ